MRQAGAMADRPGGAGTDKQQQCEGRCSCDAAGRCSRGAAVAAQAEHDEALNTQGAAIEHGGSQQEAGRGQDRTPGIGGSSWAHASSAAAGVQAQGVSRRFR